MCLGTRYRIRGVRHLMFYSLPEFPQFYPDFVNMLVEVNSGDPSLSTMRLDTAVDAYYTKYDLLKLERIVGTGRSKKMVEASQTAFVFA
jgi:U3 small nucleolar RNA-associated protein 25